MDGTTTLPPDLVTCENEPIHAPGSIQPFGVLLAIDPTTLVVRHASENSNELFGPDAVSPLGRTTAELLGTAAETALKAAIARDGLAERCPIPVSPAGAEPGQWHGSAHRMSNLVFVELEAADYPSTPSVDWLAAVRSSSEQLAAAGNIAELSATAARTLRSLSGYDRVMVYRFDGEWNGEVIAEECRADLEPFLGLHYPSSDIPPQARALFLANLANRVRVIPDAKADPIRVVSDRDTSADLPLDLGRCLLRSVALVHREYMHNMGVRASLTSPLVVGGRLWGLIACHHLSPKRPGPTDRVACDLLAGTISSKIAYLSEAEVRLQLEGLTDSLRKLEVLAQATAPPIAGLVKDADNLLSLVGATGAVVCRSGLEMLIGQTPPAAVISKLVGWVKGQTSPLFETDRLGQLYPPAKEFTGVASGLLALEVSRDAGEYVLWFRQEIIQTVNWGGKPHSKGGADGRISPRRSFALWKEVVGGRSTPWRPAELNNARRVKEVLQAASAGSLARLEALLPICAWCKKVRGEPGYWREVEEFIRDLVDVRFTHGVCPECFNKEMAEMENDP